MKQCSKCKECKSFDEFYNDKNRKDRKTPWCKTCYKKYQTSKKGKEVHRKACKKYKKTNKGKKASQREWKTENHKARHAVNIKVENGKIPPIHALNCADCNKQAQEYHHYNGYEKRHWYDIVPLCRKCHLARHST